MPVWNGSQVKIPSGAACQITATLVNTGEAQWLPAASSKGVLLHTSLGDVPFTTSVPSLQRTTAAALRVTMGQSTINLTGRMRIQGVGDFGEVLNLTLAVDSTSTGACAISLSPTAAIAALVEGSTGTINIATAVGCGWKASSPQPWVSVAPSSGSGNGAVTYTVHPNPGPARQLTILVADHPITVTQGARPDTAPAQAPVLSSTTLDFGSQPIGVASTAQAVTLANTGTVALSVGTLAIGGANSSDFAQTNTCGSTIAAGAACRDIVIFKPAAAGPRTASLFVAGAFTGTRTVALSGAGTATGPVPTVQAIVDAWTYTPGIAPGLWVTIAGRNLGGPPQLWDLDGVQQLPTTLGGVTVTFNGTPAPLAYVSPTQINALVPAAVAPGSVQVIVQVNGLSSSPFPIAAKATQPSIYALPNADGSAFFVTAALQGTSTLVGNSAVDSRATRSVYPGDVLDLYMIGLGATVDPTKFITDSLFSGAFPVNGSVTATVGGAPAPVQFAGLTSPGLYLVRISVPAGLPAGPQPIQVSAGDAQTRPLLLMIETALPPRR
jgi:uncharacterized protein (TIGR03437 family)